jgi:hypothetical protein
MTKLPLLFAAWAALGSAQPKPAIMPADYGKWETLGQAVLSPDGKWLAAPIGRTNGNYELRISPTAGGKTQIAAFGTEPAFSSDSRWVAYAVGISEADEGKLKKAKKPVQSKMGVMDLTTGKAAVIDDVASFAFSDQDAFLAFRRYPPTPRTTPATPPEAPLADTAPPADPAGATLTVRRTHDQRRNHLWQRHQLRLAGQRHAPRYDYRGRWPRRQRSRTLRSGAQPIENPGFRPGRI